MRIHKIGKYLYIKADGNITVYKEVQPDTQRKLKRWRIKNSNGKISWVSQTLIEKIFTK